MEAKVQKAAFTCELSKIKKVPELKTGVIKSSMAECKTESSGLCPALTISVFEICDGRSRRREAVCVLIYVLQMLLKEWHITHLPSRLMEPTPLALIRHPTF